MYGNVWQIDTGNAGKNPGGIEAGPTPDDWLPVALWYNGVTFIDVIVADNQATINI